MTGRPGAREAAASAAQYALLGGFAAVAAGISAQGLTGFARDNMGLHGAWPYLMFLALDGAAGVCAVLLTRRAARAESAVAPRLAVWGLVAASSSFNWTHAPHHPGAAEAFGLMPVIAAVLFEFTLRELRERTAGRADRRLTALRWLHPAERIRVQLRLAADDQISAEAATRRVRADHAARRLYLLRRALHARDQAAEPDTLTARRARIAERRAHAALTRAGFADPAIAADVLRQVQVLTQTPCLARLNYATAEAAQAAIASLITPSSLGMTPPGPDAGLASPAAHGSAYPSHAIGDGLSQDQTDCYLAASGTAGAGPADNCEAAGQDGNGDGHLIAAAARILAEAGQHGERLSQKAFADQLRQEGHRVANHSLRELRAAASARAAGDPAATQPPGLTGGPLRQPAGTATAGHHVNGTQPDALTPQPAHRPGQDAAGPAGVW